MRVADIPKPWNSWASTVDSGPILSVMQTLGTRARPSAEIVRERSFRSPSRIHSVEVRAAAVESCHGRRPHLRLPVGPS